ncbi:MAG: hypothetical protein Q8T08_01400 [Ignavibacteria bacterium]|nr:hypothetical protein [Ignavibacteria bacterium]
MCFGKNVFVILVVLFSSVLINAQNRVSPQERTKQLAEQLKLDEDQTKQVEEIFTRSQEKIMEIVQSGGMGDPSTREKVMQIREQSNEEIMKLLNDTQKEEFEKIIEEQRNRMLQRMNRN